MLSTTRVVALSMAVAAVSFFASALHAPTLVTAPFGFLLLACVGYIWTEVFLCGRAPILELVVVGVGLTLAVPIIGGVVMQQFGILLDSLAWSCLLVVVTVIGDIVLLGRASRQPTHSRQPGNSEYRNFQPRSPGLTRPDLYVSRQNRSAPDRYPAAENSEYRNFQPRSLRLTRPDLNVWRQNRSAPDRYPPDLDHSIPPRRQFSTGQAIACGVAACITASAIWLAVTGASTQQYPGYTELWLTSTSATSNADNLGVSNQDGKTETYRLVMLQSKHIVETWNLTLQPGQTWQRTVQVGSNSKADLYLLPNLKTPYRFVDAE